MGITVSEITNGKEIVHIHPFLYGNVCGKMGERKRFSFHFVILIGYPVLHYPSDGPAPLQQRGNSSSPIQLGLRQDLPCFTGSMLEVTPVTAILMGRCLRAGAVEGRGLEVPETLLLPLC